MLEQLTVRNFQKHKKLVLEFSSTVTTLVGPTDCGKSAIIRALRWVALNQPGGFSFLRSGARGVSVELVVDGQKITRLRQPASNAYYHGEEAFVSFGAGVPAPIASFLNVSEYNFQDQHDSPFWLTLSAGQVSKELNKIVDLEIIDTSLKNIASEVRRQSLVVELTQERLTEAKQERQSLRWVQDCARDMQDLDQLEQQCSLLRTKIEKLASNRNTIQKIKSNQQKFRHVPDLVRRQQEIEKLAAAKKALQSSVSRLTSSINFVTVYQQRLNQFRKSCAEVQQELDRQRQEGQCPLCGGAWNERKRK